MNTAREPERSSPAQEVPDVTADLPAWLTRARELVDQLGGGPLRVELDLLDDQLGRPEFRAAVVGEFNRGKSTLINRLVDAPLLPTGPIPTTQAFVVVGDAEQVVLTVRRADGTVESRGPGPDLWRGLAGDRAGRESEAAELRLGLPCEWLRGLRAELLDTPGTNEALEDRAAEVRQAVTVSDGVLLVVSAAIPLSRTERHLLEQEVLRRRVGFLAVVVGFLDQLAPDEREATLAAVRARVDRIAPGTPVLPAPGPEGGEDLLAAVRHQVEEFAARNGDRRWRSRKLASAVADVCDAVVDLARLAAEAAGLAEEERRARATTERAAMARDTAIWNQLRAELDGRRRTLVHRLRDSLAAETTSVVEGLRDELAKADDPTVFWERDVRGLLRTRLLALTEKTEAAVVHGLTDDIAWLDAVLAERFGVAGTVVPPAPAIAPPQPRPQPAVNDLGLARALTLIGAPLGKILAELFSGVAKLSSTHAAVVEAAGSRLGELIAENTVQVAVARRRTAVDQRLDAMVRDTLDQFTDDVSTRLERLYGELVNDLVQRRTAWRAARKAALVSAAAPPSAGPAPAATAEAAADLARRIRLAVDNDDLTLTESR